MALTTVTLTRDLRPWRKGDHIHVSAQLAETLVGRGEAQDPRPFALSNGVGETTPGARSAAAPQAPARSQRPPERPVLHIKRKARR